MKAHIVNGHIFWEHVSEGKLNQYIFDESKKILLEKGYEILETTIDKGYDIPEEIEKWVSADFVLFHFPINWFGIPAKTKAYIDNVFMSGYGKIYASDGRNNGGIYGTGGLLKSKGMIVNTWNAPKEAFENQGQIFENLSPQQFVRPFDAMLQFVGVTPQPAFAFYDVFKKPNIEEDFVHFRAHLEKYS